MKTILPILLLCLCSFTGFSQDTTQSKTDQQFQIEKLSDELKKAKEEIERLGKEQKETKPVVQQSTEYYLSHISDTLMIVGIWITILVALVGLVFPFLIDKRRMVEINKIKDHIEKSEKAAKAGAVESEFFKQFSDAENNKDWDKLIVLFTERIKLNPDDSEAYYSRGCAYKKKDNIAKAMADYNKAIKLNPDYSLAYSKRGNIYLRQDNTKAIDNYNKAIELNPDLVDAYICRGTAYAEQDNDKAIINYDKAIDIMPNCAKAHNNRGNIYLRKKEYGLAIADYDKAIAEFNAKYVDKYLARTYNNRGNAYKSEGRYTKAIADFNKSIEINPLFVKSYIGRGQTYTLQGANDKSKYVLAHEDFNKAIELKPYFPEAYFSYGICYYNEEKYAEAIVAFNQAIKFKQDYSLAYKYIGESYLQLARKLSNSPEENAEFNKLAAEAKAKYNDFDVKKHQL